MTTQMTSPNPLRKALSEGEGAIPNNLTPTALQKESLKMAITKQFSN